ncbi:MAG: hypothetical protein K2X91_05010, partial [Thermoleophilia bacterium]|nr:hypothetical protein [Thermoleophilia bacterium]
PDGKTAVAAGHTGSTWDGAASAYVFDMDKRATKGRLTGFPDTIREIAYSRDGRFVAIGYGNEKGTVKIYNASTFALVKTLTDFKGLVSSLSFDNAGRLAVAAFGGTAGVYAADTFELAGTAKLQGKQPTSIALSADGSRLAVAYADRRSVDVFTGAALKPAASPSLDGLDIGQPTTVAWVDRAGGGQDLVAAGTLAKAAAQYVVRRWPEGGKPRDVVAAGDSVMHLIPGGDGSVLFASADPSWGRVGAGGDLALSVGRVTADFRDAHDGRLAVSPNGLTVVFRPTRNSGSFQRFNVVERALQSLENLADPTEPGPSRADQRINPESDAKTLGLTDWRNNREPKLKKRTLTLDIGEMARSVAALPGGQRFALGSDAQLRLYDAGGTLLRQVQLPGTAWALAAPSAGPFVIAALGDGSIRWYNTGSERELLEEVLAVFPHRDGKRWAA